MKLTITKVCLILFLITLVTHFSLVYANIYLQNPDFLNDLSSWTTNNAEYDDQESYNSGGSLRIKTLEGANNQITGTAEQTINTTVNANDIVKLSLDWKKDCIEDTCQASNISVRIAKNSSPTDFSTILWENTTTPSTQTNWNHVSDIDVSDFFDETTTYIIRLEAQLQNADNPLAQSIAWFDNIDIGVTQPKLIVNTTGAQKPILPINFSNIHIGGAFTFKTDEGSTNLTQVKIKNTGNLSHADMSNVFLYYKEQESCLPFVPEQAVKFNTQPVSFNASNVATFNGDIEITENQTCAYIVLDIAAEAEVDKTINLRIEQPNTDIVVVNAEIEQTNPLVIPEQTIVKEYVGINYIDNPSFTGGTEYWGLSDFQYDTTWHQNSTGSIRSETIVGKNESVVGYATQELPHAIDKEDRVELSLSWSKECIEVLCQQNNISVEISSVNNPTNSDFSTIWSNTYIPSQPDERAGWFEVNNLDVSHLFNESATYTIRLKADLQNGDDDLAQSLAWFDNLNLTVAKPKQEILTTHIVDEYGNPLQNPVVNLPPGYFSSSAQQANFVFGDEENQIYIINTTESPTWSLSISAKDGPTSVWASDNDSYKYNGTQEEGRLWVNPNNLTITPTQGCTTTGLEKSNSSYFQAGETDEITILSSTQTSDNDCTWYIKGLEFVQDIPANQPIGNYTLQLNLTII